MIAQDARARGRRQERFVGGVREREVRTGGQGTRLGEGGQARLLGHLDQVREDVLAREKRIRATAFDD